MSNNEDDNKKWLDFEAIKKEADVDLILAHYNLLERMEIRSGAYVGLCPLGTKQHGKKDSFNFNLKKKTFKCFACKSHGSVLDFVAKYQGIHLRESAEVILEIMSDEANKSHKETIFKELPKISDIEKSPEQTKEFIPEQGVEDDENRMIRVPKPCKYNVVLSAITLEKKQSSDFVIYDKKEFSELITGCRNLIQTLSSSLSCLESFITETEQENRIVDKSNIGKK